MATQARIQGGNKNPGLPILHRPLYYHLTNTRSSVRIWWTPWCLVSRAPKWAPVTKVGTILPHAKDSFKGLCRWLIIYRQQNRSPRFPRRSLKEDSQGCRHPQGRRGKRCLGFRRIRPSARSSPEGRAKVCRWARERRPGAPGLHNHPADARGLQKRCGMVSP